jgi:hypothetical protein
MQIYRYKLENNTLNSVLDCDSNKTITKKIGWKGPKLYSAKYMASLHCLVVFSYFYYKYSRSSYNNVGNLKAGRHWVMMNGKFIVNSSETFVDTRALT